MSAKTKHLDKLLADLPDGASEMDVMYQLLDNKPGAKDEYAALLARLKTLEQEQVALNRILRNESGEPLADYAVELMNEYDSNITNWSTQRNRAEAAEKALEETREMLKKYFDTWGQSNQALEEARKVIAPFAERINDFILTFGGMATVEFSHLRHAAEWLEAHK